MANFNPVFALTPYTKTAIITATTTDKTGATTTNIVDIFTAGESGAKVEGIWFKFLGTSTAGTFLVFISDTSGSGYYLFDEIAYAAVTSSATVVTARGGSAYSQFELAAGQKIRVAATTVNTNIAAFVNAGDF